MKATNTNNIDEEHQALIPWLNIWFRPRQSIHDIVDSYPESKTLIPAILTGVAQALNQASIRNALDALSLQLTLIICFVGGALGGILFIYISAALMRIIGHWFGGQASATEVQAAVAWSSVPYIWSLTLWVPQFVLFGKELFTSAMPRISSSPFLSLLFLGFSLLETVTVVWSLFVLLICLSEVHRISIWKSLATTILSGIIMVIPVFCLLIYFAGLTTTH